MKAPVFIILIALVIGLVRHRELVALRLQDEQLLENHTAPGSPNPSSRSSRDSTAPLLSQLPAGLSPGLWEWYQQRGNPENTSTQSASTRQLDRTLARLDHHAMATLLQDIESDHPMSADELRAFRHFVVGMRFAVTNPQETMELLRLWPEPSLLGFDAPTIFRMWTIKRPHEAIRWFDEIGHERFSTSLLQEVILAEARSDPAGATDRVLAQEASGQTNFTHNLGMYAARLLRNDEHLDFITALTRAQSRAPHSSILAEIRRDYVLSLPYYIDQWSFEDASTLLDQGLDAKERKNVATQLAFSLRFSDPARWHAWMAAQGVTPPQSFRLPD